MKKQELIKIIESVVRKEVKKQMNEIFIREDNSSSLTELVSKPITEKEFKEPIRKKEVKPKKEVHYTSNEALNKVLNETVGGVPQGEGGSPPVTGYEDYPTLSGEVFDSSKINDVLAGSPPGVATTETVKQKKRDIGAVQSIKSRGVNVDDVPDHVTNALTRDYSAVMKAIDQKAGGTNFRP
tara:strand:+ start:2301 stop:2846 length:546 start_codon:yes stop_codon:yes gene_type:complete